MKNSFHLLHSLRALQYQQKSNIFVTMVNILYLFVIFG